MRSRGFAEGSTRGSRGSPFSSTKELSIKARRRLIVRLVDRSGGGSYGAEYFRSISLMYVVNAAAKPKQLDEIVQPMNERGSPMLAIHALPMTAEPDGSTTLDVENAADVLGRLSADTK